MSAWLDISFPLFNGLPPWPGDKPFRRETLSEAGVNGSLCTVSEISMNAHTGTHVDAPKHFVPGGQAVDQIDLDTLIGPAFVLDLTCVSTHITVGDLRGRVPEGVARLLIKTRNSRYAGDGRFHTDYLALTGEAAGYLAVSGVKLLGIDYYSIAPFDAPASSHRTFLSAPGAVALENIDLSRAEEGWVDLVCLPINITGGDGAPARVLIRKREG